MTHRCNSGTAPAAAGAVFAAVDIGASSGRVILGRITRAGGTRASMLETVHRFPNGVVESDGGLRWDFDALFAEVLTGLAAAAASAAAHGRTDHQHRDRHLGRGLRAGERRRRAGRAALQLPG